VRRPVILRGVADWPAARFFHSSCTGQQITCSPVQFLFQNNAS